MSAPIVLFDGVCNFCNGWVNRLLRWDSRRVLRFAALQSEAGQHLLEQYGLEKNSFSSFVLIDQGKAYLRSSAALKLLPYLPAWVQPARVLWLVPAFLRDGVYNLIARNRYRLFGKKDACMIPTVEQRSRFLG